VTSSGGAKVLDGIGKALQLDESDLEPSRAVLHDYGNVSSSTTWYTLGYVESVRGVRAGQRVLQVGVGSGVKCGVNVWQVMRLAA
jgi:3-ketoacyl-CoA synthase